MSFRRRIDFNVGWADTDLVDTVKVGDRDVSRLIDVVFPGGSGQPRLTMTIDSTSGIPVCSSLHLDQVSGGREVRTTDYAHLKIEDWMEYVVAAASGLVTVDASGSRVLAAGDPNGLKDALKVIRDARRTVRKKVTPAFLWNVAEVVAANRAEPRLAVMREWGKSERTTDRWILNARREHGFLDDDLRLVEERRPAEATQTRPLPDAMRIEEFETRMTQRMEQSDD